MDFHNRQYDPQLGRFMGIDPMADAAGQQALSPYHAMACNPSTLTDPLGLYVRGEAHNGADIPMYGNEMSMRFPTMPNFMGRHLNFSEYAAQISMAEGQKWLEERQKEYALSESLGAAVEGLVIGNYSISIYTGIHAQLAFMGLQKEEFDYNMSQVHQGFANINSRGTFAWFMPPEEPINLFTSRDDVFNRYTKSIAFTRGDNKFYVTGHGGDDFIQDGSGEYLVDYLASNPKRFDAFLSKKSPAYKKAIEENSVFVMYLFVCTSTQMAQQLSLLHKNAFIIGADGYLIYGKGKDGSPSLLGVSSKRYENLNDRFMNIYRNGNYIGKMVVPFIK